MNISKHELEKEIEGIQKQAQEALKQREQALQVIKQTEELLLQAEGALKILHHLMAQVDKPEGEHKTLDGEVVPESKE
ncbi:MAG: hypothetical protein AB7J46_06370 [Candidatus Altimarinota bacterium]